MSVANNVSDVNKVGQRAIYFQEGGSSPASKPFYRGETSTGGWNVPLGDVTAINLPNPDSPSDWDIVDVFQGQVGLVTSDFTARVNTALFRKWDTLKNRRCPINVFIKHDSCGKPSDFNSWEYVKIYTAMRITDFTDSADNPLDGDGEAAVDLTGSFTALRALVAYPMRFEAQADASLLADAIDGFFAGQKRCGGKCGKEQNECSELYVLQIANTGSPGLSSQIVFSIDDQQTYQAVDIPTLGGVSGTAIAYAGSYLVLVSANQAKHHFIRLASLHNGDASAWDTVSINYAGALRSIWAKSAAEIYIGGNAGYAYKLDDPTSEPTILTDGSITTDDLVKAHGFSATVIFGSSGGKVLVSTNEGLTFESKSVTLADGTVITGAITALHAISESIWFVAIGGNLYYTQDFGDTYTEKPISDSATVINDIRFYSSTIGYLAAEVNGAAKVYRSINSGNTWFAEAPSIAGLPTAQRISFVAPCSTNKVAAGGRVTVGGDGVLAIAE